METASVLIQSLCVPCRSRCRYCLLSWDGRTVGADWDRSVALAERWLCQLRRARPEVDAVFSFGYCMEHPDLREALRTLRRLGSPTADFLQCDGMAMRDAAGCAALMALLGEEGVRQLNFTVYGPEEYHDRFAGRRGDFALLTRMMAAARQAGLPFSAGIPLTGESAPHAPALVARLRDLGCDSVRLFIPHEEGRGRSLSPIRLTLGDLLPLPEETQSLLNRRVYRTEGEWLASEPVREEKRQILLSICRDNVDDWETRSVPEVLRRAEALDEAYYAAFPTFRELGRLYGDPAGTRLYSYRDLFAHYRARFARDRGLNVQDVTDERYTGSRRYGGS